MPWTFGLAIMIWCVAILALCAAVVWLLILLTSENRRRQGLAMVLVGMAAFVVGLAILPWLAGVRDFLDVRSVVGWVMSSVLWCFGPGALLTGASVEIRRYLATRGVPVSKGLV